MKQNDFIRTAKRQFRNCCIPTLTAIAVSVMLARTGAPLITAAAVVGAGYAYIKGYRIRIFRVGGEENEE